MPIGLLFFSHLASSDPEPCFHLFSNFEEEALTGTMENDEEGPSIGARPKPPKGPNPLNQSKRDLKARRKREEGEH
ncbi:unnamed protein product [Microthlaspi erraticum]|uniref:Uncharacterized protein n=1 Tax=Microthlaspi erraticum TaxID=1685480 RepID=A0A6D2K184_9BRAS|nr:unnamed protein product [Microthlaspi erraticum]